MPARRGGTPRHDLLLADALLRNRVVLPATRPAVPDWVMTRMTLYRDENLHIQQDVRPSLRAATPDGLDMLIANLRSKRAGPTDAALMGPSLMEFLGRRGDVIDDGGDFAAMGARTAARLFADASAQRISQ